MNKTRLRWLFFTLNCVIWMALVLVAQTAYSQISQVINVTSQTPGVSPIDSAIKWLGVNWTVIALAASELAALLPSKVNGIIHGVIRGLRAFFNK